MRDMECNECNNQFCKLIPPKCRETLCSAAEKINYKRKQRFLLMNDEVLIINSGCIIPSVTSEMGIEKGVNILDSGLLGIATLRINEKLAFDVYVLRELDGCIVPKFIFQRLCSESHEFALAMIEQLCNYLYVTTKNTSILFEGDSRHRIESITNLVSKGLKASIRLTHEEIALLTGLNRVTVSKIIQNINNEKE